MSRLRCFDPLHKGIVVPRQSVEVDPEQQWACLLGQPAGAFVTAEAYANLVAGPSFDSDYLPQRWPQPSDRLHLKQVLIGNSAHDGTTEIEFKRRMQGSRDLTGLLIEELQSFGLTDFDQLLALYINGTACSDPECAAVVKEMYDDVLFKCPVLYFSEYLSSLSHTVFSYSLDYYTPASNEPDSTLHDDLAMLFGEPLSGVSTNADRSLSRKLIDIVSGFARNGQLPHVSSAAWPKFSSIDTRHRNVAIGHTENKLVTDTRIDKCSLLRRFILPADFHQEAALLTENSARALF
ncbi:hypothetical protein HPB49_002770 [Dermacentor silvarum]|uniref:Uncharacterized protein n=1 Tax=Dermacentor silvarum TaxID=543639 RepID=A0ACB8DAB0_DERSI|nr:hypothetical protein HPB49_002770 [Dermacentor silvarum]